MFQFRGNRLIHLPLVLSLYAPNFESSLNPGRRDVLIMFFLLWLNVGLQQQLLISNS